MRAEIFQNKLKNIFIAILVTIFAVGTNNALAQEKNSNKDRGATVSVDDVRLETARQSVPVIGRLVSAQSGVVSVVVKGPVLKIIARVGDKVNKGDQIALLHSDSVKWSRALAAAETEAAKARTKIARAQVELRRQELKRLEELKTSSAFSPARFDDARQELVKAEGASAEADAQLIRAHANLKLAEIDLANTTIRAPYAGVITKVHTESGSYLAVGQPVVSMISDIDMEIEASVPTDRIGGLLAGTEIPFRIGNTIKGISAVRAVVPEENPQTRTREVRFTPLDDAVLKNTAANQSVTLEIPAGAVREVISVHKDAVLNRGGKQVVFVAVEGKAKMQPVSLGEAIGQRFIVIGGLQPGDRVVVRGNERLRPEQDINIKAVGE
ncbi:MAG: efflux RND transporter periplasmic adaptor subunit [Rhodospirillaceae bacterium]|nr:efflux RND transporter periplasmic adaptor subunit [Rhodospirillaceae bacterium]